MGTQKYHRTISSYGTCLVGSWSSSLRRLGRQRIRPRTPVNRATGETMGFWSPPPLPRVRLGPAPGDKVAAKLFTRNNRVLGQYCKCAIGPAGPGIEWTLGRGRHPT